MARSRQKSYADKRRNPLEFKVGDRMLLKVSPWKGVVRFGKKGKLAPRYMGPFEIVECVRLVAYRLKLPQELSCVHDTFHVSNLKKCLAEPDVQVPLDEIEIDENLHFVKEPIEIVERDVKTLNRIRIPLVKVRWNSWQGAEYTWEREDQFRKKYPHLFTEPVPSSSGYKKFKDVHELHLKMNLELLKKEKCHVKPNKVGAESRGSFLEVVGTIWVQTSKAEDASTEMLCGLDQLVERKEDGGLYF
nr:putative reverse transcriptase domain-containing protein [Tanacetum cinerariifolium]